VYAKSSLDFVVQLTVNFPVAIRFSKLSVEFSDPTYNSDIKDDQSITDMSESSNSLLFHPETTKQFSFHFTSKEKMDLKVINELNYC
jgi:hypothetical protein